MIIVNKLPGTLQLAAVKAPGYENPVQAGVIDPTKVVRSALQNAAAIGRCC
jgi:chaperonin GroEL (HSP60 family)